MHEHLQAQLLNSPGLWPRACQIIDKSSLFPLAYFPSSPLLPIFFSTSHRPTSLLPIVWKLEGGGWKLEAEVGSWFFVVLECAHACLRRRQGGPWAPGAPPRGAIPAQSTTFTSCRGPLGIASNRFVVDLVCLWVSFLIPIGALFGPSWCQNRLRAIF